MDPTSRRRTSRWAAVLLGIVLGTHHFWVSMGAFFTLSEKDGLVGLIGVVAASFTLLPLSLLGIFRPKLAAYLLFGSLATLTMALLISVNWKSLIEDIVENIGFWTLYAIPSSVVAALLLYSGKQVRSVVPEVR